MEKIRVTVDKSHLITIGERLYAESVELLRELVNNAYDADAIEVEISISDDEIIVEDNGSGMDFEGLGQYFNIGSPFKRQNPISPKFSRTRIGEFGIGKFSVLSTCDHFEVFTKKGDFAGTVIFNKNEWNMQSEEWQLPLQREIISETIPDGSRIVLKGLKKKFDIESVKRRLIETLPLKAPNFNVHLNGKKLLPQALTGRKIPFLEGTDCGIVNGEIIILPVSKMTYEEAGVLIRVKQVSIRRLPFGIESSLLPRITGEVNADFLPLTTDRNDFVRDTQEFKIFSKVMERIIARVKEELNRQSDQKENSRIRRALKEVTKKIELALMKNKEWCPPGFLPVGDLQGEGSDVASIGVKTDKTAGKQKPAKPKSKSEKKRAKYPHLKRLTPGALVRKVKIGQMNLALVLDHFGSDAPESFIDGEIIYVNRDHPLYIRESKNRERHIMNVARLICQEISLMSKPRDPRHAYERQSKLLKDAFIK